MNVEQEAKILCPYCSSPQTLLLDISAGDQTMVEDCEACCQPMLLTLHVENGNLSHCDVQREND